MMTRTGHRGTICFIASLTWKQKIDAWHRVRNFYKWLFVKGDATKIFLHFRSGGSSLCPFNTSPVSLFFCLHISHPPVFCLPAYLPSPVPLSSVFISPVLLSSVSLPVSCLPVYHLHVSHFPVSLSPVWLSPCLSPVYMSPVSQILSCSVQMSDCERITHFLLNLLQMSDSLKVTHLSWAIRENCSQSLI